MNGILIDKIYLGICFKKYNKKEREYITNKKKKKDIGDIIKNKFEDFLKALLNPKRNKQIIQYFIITKNIINQI